MGSQTNHNPESLESRLEAWGVSVAQAPAPPLPAPLRAAVIARRSQRRVMRIIAGTAGVAVFLAVALLVLNWASPRPAAQKPLARSIDSPEKDMAATLVSLTRVNASFDPARLHLPDDLGSVATPEPVRAFTPRGPGKPLDRF